MRYILIETVENTITQALPYPEESLPDAVETAQEIARQNGYVQGTDCDWYAEGNGPYNGVTLIDLQTQRSAPLPAR